MIQAWARIQHQLNQQGDRWGFWTRQFTGTLGTSCTSLTNTDVRTFVFHWVLSWHWKPHSAPSFGSVSRTSPLREAGWWPLGMAWLVMSFLSKYFLRSEIKLPCLVESRSEINCHYVGTQYCFYSTGAIIRWVEIVVAHKNDTSQLTSEERGNIPFKKYSIKGF
jgi:hypothetical protein